MEERARDDRAEIRDDVLNLEHGHVADVVEHLNDQEPEDAAELIGKLPDERAIEILDQPEFEDSAEVVANLPIERAVALLAGMSADRATDLLTEVEEPLRSELLARLDPETRNAVSHLASYPEGSAGAIMTTEVVSVPTTWTVGDTLRHIRVVEKSRETIYTICVLDPKTRALVQTVTLRRLITADPAAPVLSAARYSKPITVTPTTDQEEAARLFSKYDLLAVPVVDDAYRVIGIVTVDDIIDAIFEESTEDAQKFGGMEALDEPYMDISFLKMMKKRAGWLCALFLGEMLTATAMQHFETELEKAIVLTLFIPLIMSSGGNSGSQATSLIIRALALGEVKVKDWWRVALRELPSGLALGAILGTIGIIRISVWQMLGLYDYGPHWILVALTVGTGLLGIVTFGSMSGSMLPFLLKRLGFDPASASAPFVATLVDVTGLVIYFSVAVVILSGTLL
ncbi:magnesium transporter [Kaistia dalseonensis]|uniref:Magnesium transporter MgtE n=1 Tax=Kaistia dalseonensis TaxID=410840 RepID=A0ABU0H177_9HYPH|nr:magnesium transporter [Kaistia dalseonensis]MCX5493496.1 magnesium transporter [Kaistia dalseonensis]MDQ0436056.1 magnesium transporter [Kaistia dalseonensis]